MQVISTSQARKSFNDIINTVYYENTPIAIGQKNKAKILLIKSPAHFNSHLSEITNINAYSSSFDFLREEEELYSLDDINSPNNQ